MTKSESLLLQKFIQESVQVDSELNTIYTIIKSDRPFEQLIYWLKMVVNNGYDFEFLSKEAKALNSNRRDVRALLEIFAEMLGNKIDELCEANYLFVAPTKFEDYCPYPSEELVCYTKKEVGSLPIFDGYKWRIIDIKTEETPYYNIKCCQIERV